MDTHRFLVLILMIPVINALRDVRVLVPSAVRKHDNVLLNCFYDMEEDSLYSVKWYKGRREFYRYTPKEKPPMQIFPIVGATVIRAASNESQLALSNVSLPTAGKYSCEVSADAPSFHTLIVAGDLEVVDVPETKPQIHGIRPKYKPGEILKGNCTSRYSRPAANLTWMINDVMANPSHVRPHKYKTHRNDLEISVLSLHFVVGSQHFRHGRLKVKCISRIHDVYYDSSERNIEESRPKTFDSDTSQENIVFNQPPYSLYDDDNEVIHKKGEMSSLSQGPINQISYRALLLAVLTFIKFNFIS